MITAVVQFTLSSPMPSDKMKEAALATVPTYEGMPGLIRKYYVSTDDGATVGGMYLWESREAADAVYNAAWCERVTAAYGSGPMITFFDTPVVVDNRHDETIS